MKLVLLILLLTFSLLTTAAFVGRKTRSNSSADAKTEVLNAVEVQGASERGPVRMIRFVLSRDGIYPKSMRVDRGLLNIALEDKTGESEGLLIESVRGDQRTKISQIRRAEKHWRGRAVLRLMPGTYVVSDASQPGLTAELIVNP